MASAQLLPNVEEPVIGVDMDADDGDDAARTWSSVNVGRRVKGFAFMRSIAPELAVYSIRTLTDALTWHSRERPDDIAYVFLQNGEGPGESITYRELDEAARARAGAFEAAGLSGKGAVLLYPSGLEFVRTLMGCMYAGVVAAPLQVPRHRQGVERIISVAHDIGTNAILTTVDVGERLGGPVEQAGLAFLGTDALPATGPRREAAHEPRPEDIALLQYTSGSTSDPKGVMVSHSNFLSNVRETDAQWPCRHDATFVSWLPLFHDMGLLFGVVLPLWSGSPSYLMAPEAFIRRPSRWLEAISRFGGTHAAAPSFGYDLCVRAMKEDKSPDIGDLSRWRVAANGAEPVRWHTIRAFAETFAPYGFDPRAMSPGYGLAENTLKATGTPLGRAPRVLWVSSQALGDGRVEPVDGTRDGARDGATPLVSSGVPVLDTSIRIADPVTGELCPPGRVGEIWISGPCVAMGYLGRPELSRATFQARLRHDVTGQSSDADHGYLRTGDLGFLRDGELYVTGRLKDVIIHRGRNYYPQDIELAAESVLVDLRLKCTAAFSVEEGDEERIIVAIEANGRVLNGLGPEVLAKRIQSTIREQLRLNIDDVVIVRRGVLPKTTSGKIQRQACKKLYTSGALTSHAVHTL